jgi:hypothetical protein
MRKPDIDWILGKTLKILPPAFVILFLVFLTYCYLYYPDIFFVFDSCHYWGAIRPAVMMLGTFLVTPYPLVYNNILLSIALACWGWEGYTQR